MMQRLPEPAGLLLDRAEPIAFRFEGKRYEGFRGDTVASALAANDVAVLSRSFKYHRPRGIHSLSGLDANTLVQVGPAPNRFAEREPLASDLEVTGQNYWGTLRHDRLAALGLLHRFLPAGFYYKAFYKPRWTWPLWAKLIRRIAGLGTVDTNARHGYFDKQYLFCDVLVVGGGAAGLAAAARRRMPEPRSCSPMRTRRSAALFSMAASMRAASAPQTRAHNWSATWRCRTASRS